MSLGHYLVHGARLACARGFETLATASEHAPCVEAFHVVSEEVSPRPWEEQFTVPHGPDDARPFLSIDRHDGAFRLRFHGQCDFVVDGPTIVVAGARELDPLAVEQLLVDQVVPRALQARGRTCLHASAAVGPEGVVALLGASGAGKSTLCAALARRDGWRLLADDAVTIDDGRAWPGYPSLRLWPDAAAHLAEEALPLATPRTSKRRLTAAAASGPVALARLVILVRDDGASALSLEPLRPARALEHLMRGLHRLDAASPRLRRAEFAALTTLAEAVPIFTLRYAPRLEQVEDMAETLARTAVAARAHGVG